MITLNIYMLVLYIYDNTSFKTVKFNAELICRNIKIDCHQLANNDG